MKIRIEDCINDYTDEVKNLLHHRSKLKWYEKMFLWFSVICLLLFSLAYLFVIFHVQKQII